MHNPATERTFWWLFFQLSVIEPIRRDVLDARNAMNMGDYSAAVELLGKAIEVTLFKATGKVLYLDELPLL